MMHAVWENAARQEKCRSISISNPMPPKFWQHDSIGIIRYNHMSSSKLNDMFFWFLWVEFQQKKKSTFRKT